MRSIVRLSSACASTEKLLVAKARTLMSCSNHYDDLPPAAVSLLNVDLMPATVGPSWRGERTPDGGPKFSLQNFAKIVRQKILIFSYF